MLRDNATRNRMSEPDVSNLLTVQQAIAILDAASVSPRVVRLPLAQAGGLRLAAEIVADRDYPPFDRSLMDGYAVRCATIVGAPTELPIAGTIAAGAEIPAPLSPGAAVAIMTGAPMPAGADCVVPVEDTTKLDDGRRVRIGHPSSPGKFIARRGSDCPAGRVVLSKGAKLTPAAIAVAASVGAHDVEVFARPSCLVFSTGDEIVPLDATPGPTQIRNSNTPMIVTLLERLGADAADGGIIADEPTRIRATIQAALDQRDIVFITGGMSMGEFDFVPRVLGEIGVELKITKLRIKPGKPFVFGAIGTRFVFGLPGNPVSGFACTLRLCSRLIARLGGGSADETERWLRAPLAQPLEANGPREFYQSAILSNDGHLFPLTWKGSADIYTLAQANVLLVRPENDPPQPAGAIARALHIP
jgi:molybdopterin molybdotransferase